MECMCAQTKPRFILSSERVLGEWSQNPCQLQGKNPLYRRKVLLSGGSYPRRCIKQDSEPNTLPMSYSGPQLARLICNFYIRVTARAVACTDPSPRDTGHVAVTFKNPDTIKHTIRSASCLIHPCLVLCSNLFRSFVVSSSVMPPSYRISSPSPSCSFLILV